MNGERRPEPHSSSIAHPSSFRRIAVLIEYDGSAYEGSQRQAQAPSIQATLETAVERLTGRAVKTAFAGRTDAGVHATGQVVAFDTEAGHSVEVWQRALNALLPRDIAVRAVAEVGAGFDPRRHARSRTYCYRIWNAPVRSPLASRMMWHVAVPLDIDLMARAAGMLEGEHDFAAFGGSPGPGRSTWRRIMRAGLFTEGRSLKFTVEATAFLPHQVRRTVGALVEIGRGRLPPESFKEWLARPAPGVAGPTAPPHGLCLIQVHYGRDEPAFRGDDEKRVRDEDL